jgi:hypothetical protein
MARLVIQSNKDKVYFSTYKQKGKILSDNKLESLISSLNRLKHFVNTPSKERHNTLLKLADKKRTDVI